MSFARNSLAESLQELYDVLGFEGVNCLVQTFGGIRLNVPSRFSETHRYAALLGDDLFKKLVQYCGGSELVIPRNLLSHNGRIRELKKLILSNVAPPEIAMLLQITERHVYKLMLQEEMPARPRIKDPNQLDMFFAPDA